MLLIGLDLAKSLSVLLPAYNDAQGITAQFNLNVLHRINAELGANVPVASFEHEALWNADESRIEMHLRATRDVSFKIDGHEFHVPDGDTIHTENSYKFGSTEARFLLRAGGWSPVRGWTDNDGWFAIILAERHVTARSP